MALGIHQGSQHGRSVATDQPRPRALARRGVNLQGNEDAKAKVQEIKDELNRQRLQQHFVVVPPNDPKASHHKSPVRTMFRSVIDLVEYGKDDEVGQPSSDYKPTTVWPTVWHDQPEWTLTQRPLLRARRLR